MQSNTITYWFTTQNHDTSATLQRSLISLLNWIEYERSPLSTIRSPPTPHATPWCCDDCPRVWLYVCVYARLRSPPLLPTHTQTHGTHLLNCCCFWVALLRDVCANYLRKHLRCVCYCSCFAFRSCWEDWSATNGRNTSLVRRCN